MDVESQSSPRDQLYESTIGVLDIIGRAEYHERADFGTLEEHLKSLQDTLLGSLPICTPQLDPFYALCLQLCDSFRSQSSTSGKRVHLANVSVMGYKSCQLRDLLLALFHALSTYLNIIRWYVILIHWFICYAKVPASDRGTLDDNSKQRCMACIFCAIRGLEEHRAHLNSLDESLNIIQQLHYTSMCLSMFYGRLRGFGVDRYSQHGCDCLGQGSTRTSSWKEDIILIRIGDDALGHFSSCGENLLQEVIRRRCQGEYKIVEDISKAYEDVEGRFRTALRHLDHGELLISFEILTRGYRLDFMGMSPASLGQLGFR